MTRTQWFHTACGGLLAAALMGQSSAALAVGCFLQDRPWSDVEGNFQSLSCADGSAEGSVEFVALEGALKTYRLEVELIDDPAPAQERAIIRLQNGAGQTFPAVQDLSAGDGAAEQDQDIAVNFEMEFIELEAGDAQGN